MRAPWEKWYHTKRWERRSRLQKQMFPLCAICKDHGVVMQADVADHVIPHKGDEQLFWFGELQSLCKPHHDGTKQQQELRGFSSDIGNDGFPIDDQHPFNQHSSSKRKAGRPLNLK